MRGLLGTLAAVAVMALAFWAYRENYRTQAALRELAAVRAEMAAREEAIAVLRAEWAYLNRPDRLRDLAEINFDRLGLVPIEAGNLGRVDGIPYPPPESEAATGAPLIEDVVPTMGTFEDDEELVP